jgi:AraC-like DNA-binding protein
MDKIALRKLHEMSSSGILLMHIQDGVVTQDIDILSFEEVHSNNHYLFFLLECEETRVLVDFKEYYVQGVSLGCVLPGQVHPGISLNNVSGWVMCLDAMFVEDEWKEFFETVLISGKPVIVPDTETQDDLRFCFTLLNKKMQSQSAIQSSTQRIVCALATSLAGIIAESFRQQQSVVFNKRLMSILLQFKALIAVHLKTVKSPAQYASMLHISPTYLNEAVKKITGFPAGYWIQYVILLEAKRLLFYTSKSIKEIAFELGYDDHTYFTRLFTKQLGIPPTLFRENYRK